MAPLEIYCYHRPLLHLFAWIRLSTTTPGCWKFSRQKRREEERRRKQAHIFSGTFEVCLIFCKIGSEEQLSNVKRLACLSEAEKYAMLHTVKSRASLFQSYKNSLSKIFEKCWFFSGDVDLKAHRNTLNPGLKPFLQLNLAKTESLLKVMRNKCKQSCLI